MTRLSSTVFESLRRLDTSSVSNGIERFGVRLRDEGFAADEIHAPIARAKKCAGCITDGAGRDLKAVAAFPLFFRGVSVTHAYVHIVDFGNPVEIGGDVPDIVRRLQAQEKKLTGFCLSDRMRLVLKET
jgi:hypothetical protein